VRPPRVLIYSPPAVGKSTFASRAPNPFVIDADKGSHKLDVQRVVPETWTEVRDWMTEVEHGRVKCDTLVLDSITELEALSHRELFAGQGIDKWDGGWGHGDTHALMAWREMVAQLERIWMLGKNIILVAHAQVKRFDDPTLPAGAGSYDRFEVAARKNIAGMLIQSVDFVLFAREEVVTTHKNNTTRATTTNARYIYTRRSPAYDAKSRGTILFPDRLLLDWEEFSAAIKNDGARREQMIVEIEAMLSEMVDPELTKSVRDYVKAWPNGIVEAYNRVSARAEEFRKRMADTKVS
jgi:hypothetical protein